MVVTIHVLIMSWQRGGGGRGGGGWHFTKLSDEGGGGLHIPVLCVLDMG